MNFLDAVTQIFSAVYEKVVVENLDRIYGGDLSQYQDLKAYNEAQERLRIKPKIEPRPFVPSGRGGIVVKTTPPTGDNAPNYTPPKTIQADAVWEDLAGIATELFPKIWEWLEEKNAGPIPWLTKNIRTRFKEISPQEPTEESSFKFGKLLTGNMTLERFEATELTHCVDPADLTRNHQESYESFSHWLAHQAGGVPLAEDYKGDFYDQGALLWPLDQRDFSGGVTLLFGARFLGDILANWWTGSLNYDAATLRGTTYLEVNVTRLKASWERNYSENPNEIDSNSGQDGLALSIANILNEFRGEKPHVVLQNSSLGGNFASLEKILAVKDFPFKVPVSLLLEPEDITDMSEEELDEKAYEKIESIPQLILWLTKALDELIGKFPLTMEIGESDLLDLNDEYAAWKAKKKPEIDKNLPFYLQNDKLISYREEGDRIIKTVKVPNLAEAIAEMMGTGLAEGQRNGLALEILSRCLFEIGSTKNVGVQTGAWVDAIADYLGFATTDRLADVEYTYNPVINKERDGESISKMLEPTSVKVALPEYNDKQTLETHMAVMRELHAICKTALTEGIGNTDSQLKNKLKDYAQLLGITPKAEVERDRNGNPVQPEPDDFDAFLEKIERGFIDEPGVTDPLKPYGREFDKRPRIRRLSKED